MAADPVYPIIPTDEIAYDWTGLYAGVSVSGQRGIVDSSDPLLPLPSLSGVGVGVHVGHNWQSGNFVFGAEAGFGYSFASASAPCGNPAWTCNTELTWSGSLVGRVGVAADTALFYLTGGVAGASFRASTVDDTGLGGPVGAEYPDSQFRAGWTLGGGIELALSDTMTGRLDYRYADYGSRDMVLDIPYPGVSLKTHSIALGVSFRF